MNTAQQHGDTRPTIREGEMLGGDDEDDVVSQQFEEMGMEKGDEVTVEGQRHAQRESGNNRVKVKNIEENKGREGGGVENKGREGGGVENKGREGLEWSGTGETVEDVAVVVSNEVSEIIETLVSSIEAEHRLEIEREFLQPPSSHPPSIFLGSSNLMPPPPAPTSSTSTPLTKKRRRRRRGGDVDSYTDTVTVPYSWKREVKKGKVTYISPSGVALQTMPLLREYLLTEGTCKCGLECPVILDKMFSYNPNLSSVVWGGEGHLPSVNNLCNHRRHMLLMADLHRTTSSSSSLPSSSISFSSSSSSSFHQLTSSISQILPFMEGGEGGRGSGVKRKRRSRSKVPNITPNGGVEEGAPSKMEKGRGGKVVKRRQRRKAVPSSSNEETSNHVAHSIYSVLQAHGP